MTNVIYRGPLDRAPKTVNKPVTGALLPGTAVEESATNLVALATAASKRVLILSNMDFKDQTVSDAYTSGDTGIAYLPRHGDRFAVAMAAATYTLNQELTVDANGRFAAAASGNRVVAFFVDTPATLTAGALADVEIADGYIKA